VVGDVFGPGHLGELTQVIDVALVDAVAVQTGTVQRRVRRLPTRVVIFFVLALALFESCAYRQVWAKLAGGVVGSLVAPSAGALTRARQRVGVSPFVALFEAVCGPVAVPGTRGVFWRRLRVVAFDGTSVHVPDSAQVAVVARKRRTRGVEFGYPLLRVVVLVECGTRALLGAAFGPESVGEVGYARRLLERLDRGMLLLGDCGFDDAAFLTAVGQRAQFLCRSGAKRTPLVGEALPDGSYLSSIRYGQLPVRIIEAWVVVTYADGVTRREQWRLLTSLLDHRAYPAGELVTLYHERWEVETTIRSIKSSMLGGRVLRSPRPADIDQEIWAMLTVYQALVRITTDAAATQPGLDPDRISFTIALHTAQDQVTRAAGREFTGLVGAIGRAVLDQLLPARRPRVQARSVKNPVSKYGPKSGSHPQKTLTYTVHTHVMIMEEGLTPRRRS
jgi:hypothetical protein